MNAHERIESPHNPRLKAIARLRRRRERKRESVFLIDGVREIERALAGGQPIETVVICREFLPADTWDKLMEHCRSVGVEVLEAGPQAFAKIAYGHREEGVVAVARALSADLASWSPPQPGSIYLVLEAIEKPGNLGAIFRTADALGIAGIVLAEAVVLPENPNAIRASLGTVFSVPFAIAENGSAVRWLQTHGVRLFAARVQAAQVYWDVDYFQPAAPRMAEDDSQPPSLPAVALVLGSEAHGLSPAWQGPETTGIRIPQSGIADSLNLSVATAILAAEMARQRQQVRPRGA